MAKDVRRMVRKGYADMARKGTSCCVPPEDCCGASDADGVASVSDYTDAELAALPDGTHMGLSRGNPAAIAALRPGEVVLDLGSGGGFGVFVAARKVGPKGRAIGVDMTPEMLSSARRNAAQFRELTGLNNVEFRLGEIEHLPVADASVDVVISHCVINLSPDKQQVWREIARVLKPGGRVAVSDLALLKPLPKRVKESMAALVGCVAGALLVDMTRAMAAEAGLVQITLTTQSEPIESMEEWKDPWYDSVSMLLSRSDRLSDYVTSLYVEARKRSASRRR